MNYQKQTQNKPNSKPILPKSNPILSRRSPCPS